MHATELPADSELAAVSESLDHLSPERLELARRAFALKSRGKTYEEVAGKLEISRSTVVRILDDYRASYAKSLVKTPVPHLIAEEMARIEEFEATVRRKADEATSGRIEHGYLRLALMAMKTRLELLLSTGIIPKEPEKIYSIMHSVSSGPDEEKERTEEEMKEDILQLLKKGRRI